ELGPAPHLDTLLIDEPEVGLVHQCRGLERVPFGLRAHVAVSLPAQLAIHEWQELAQGRLVTPPPRLEQWGDVIGVGSGHPTLSAPREQRRAVCRGGRSGEAGRLRAPKRDDTPVGPRGQAVLARNACTNRELTVRECGPQFRFPRWRQAYRILI